MKFWPVIFFIDAHAQAFIWTLLAILWAISLR